MRGPPIPATDAAAYLRAGDGNALGSLLAREVVPPPVAPDPGRIAAHPRDAAAHRAAFRAHRAARRHDAAWCSAAVLSYLGAADREEQAVFERDRLRAPIRPRSVLDREHAALLAHPDEDRCVSAALEPLWRALLSFRGKSDRDAGLQTKHQVDPTTHTGVLPRTFGFAAHLLGIEPPRLFLRTDVPGGITAMPVWPPAALAGSTLLSGPSPTDLLFLCGRFLSHYRSDRYVVTLAPTTIELRTLFAASLRIAGAEALDADAERAARQLREKVGPGQLVVLRRAAAALVARGGSVDLLAWLRAVELGACRAGTLLCADLATAVRVIRKLGPALPEDLPTDRKIDDAIAFFASEQHRQLRRALGIDVRR